jgi:hypothetical protein
VRVSASRLSQASLSMCGLHLDKLKQPRMRRPIAPLHEGLGGGILLSVLAPHCPILGYGSGLFVCARRSLLSCLLGRP